MYFKKNLDKDRSLHDEISTFGHHLALEQTDIVYRASSHIHFTAQDMSLKWKAGYSGTHLHSIITYIFFLKILFAYHLDFCFLPFVGFQVTKFYSVCTNFQFTVLLFPDLISTPDLTLQSFTKEKFIKRKYRFKKKLKLLFCCSRYRWPERLLCVAEWRKRYV